MWVASNMVPSHGSLPLLTSAQPAALLGAGWQRSLLLALAAACILAAGRAMLAVQCESLTYIRLLGVQLASRRRSGLWSSAQFIPLRQLQGIIIHEVRVRGCTPVGAAQADRKAGRLADRLACQAGMCARYARWRRPAACAASAGQPCANAHQQVGPGSLLLTGCCQHRPPPSHAARAVPAQEVTSTSVHFWLGLMLKKAAADGGAGAAASAEGLQHALSSTGGGRRLIADGGEVEVAFPTLRPQLNLLRQVYQQLQPLLTTDLDAVAGGAQQAGSKQNGGEHGKGGAGEH